jgi:hypothetical protein
VPGGQEGAFGGREAAVPERRSPPAGRKTGKEIAFLENDTPSVVEEESGSMSLPPRTRGRDEVLTRHRPPGLPAG